jgi:polyisoprenyl-phosphate glycosyltransferase
LKLLLEQLDGEAEVILVDDGSREDSLAHMIEASARDPRFKVLQLSRNFGQQAAITAGLDFASGNAVVVMDADLQDPPEVVLELARRWREGFDVVYAVRSRRAGENRFKLATAAGFYRLLRRLSDVDIPADVGDFRLVDRKALEAYKTIREEDRFVRGMLSWVGFRQTGVLYERDERYAGKTKYPLRRMLHFAIDGIVSFSNAPLRLALALGFRGLSGIVRLWVRCDHPQSRRRIHRARLDLGDLRAQLPRRRAADGPRRHRGVRARHTRRRRSGPCTSSATR